MAMTGAHINLQPSFRGPLHARDEQEAALDGGSVDPSPLLDHGPQHEEVPSAPLEGAAPHPDASNGAGDANRNHNDDDDDAAPTRHWRHHPLQSTQSYFASLRTHFGRRFLAWLAIDQLFVSGGAFALLMALGLPLFKELGIGASRQQLYMTLIFSPWAMKPFIGVFSDLLPLGGYHKRYLAVYSIVVGMVGCSVLLGVYHNGSAELAKEEGSLAVTNFADVVVVCFTFVSFEAATLDILGEGKYSELMRLHPESGSSIISFKFGWALLGGIVVTSTVGPLADRGYFHVLFWIALALSITPLFPTLAGWIPETKRTAEELGLRPLCCQGCLLFDEKTYREKRAVFLVITACGLAAPALAAITTYANVAIGLAFSALLIAAFIVATYYIFPGSFFKVFVAIILFSLDWISMGSALGYFYTASEECVPGGPNFDYTFYISITGIVGSIVNFLGVLLYQSTLSSWRFRPVLLLTIAIGSMASIIDIIIIMRWNVQIGIPDKVFFICGNAICETLIGSMWALASSTIFAKIAPPGMESAVFAYTVGIGNFCTMVSGLLGSGVIKWSGMVTTGDSCNFDALPYLIIICQVVTPLCIGIPATFLVPNTLQTEHLIDWEEEEGWGSKVEEAKEEESTDTGEESCSVVV